MTAARAPQPRPNDRVSARRGALVATVVHLWPYIWPSDRADLKWRVMGAMLLLLAAKLATIAVPFTFIWATAALAGTGSAEYRSLASALDKPTGATLVY
jgi:ATP-binding cassette subfamily B protein